MRIIEDILKNPIRGDIVRSEDLGYTSLGSKKYVWIDCPICGKFRWVRYETFQILRKCRLCSHAKIRLNKGSRSMVEFYEEDLYDKYRDDNKDIIKSLNIINNKVSTEIQNIIDNPKEGDIIDGKYIERGIYLKYIWCKCRTCGKLMWRVNNNKEIHRKTCRYCSKYIKSDKMVELRNIKPRKTKYSTDAIGEYKLIKKGDIPNVGDLIRGTEIGKNYSSLFVWRKCATCGECRWVAKTNIKYLRCQKCGNLYKKEKYLGEKSGNWKGGRIISHQGYIFILIRKDSLYYPMVNYLGYVAEHRLVMAQSLGRCLERWEIVHHKHIKYPIGSIENKQDNRLENLELISSKDKHDGITYLDMQVKNLKKKVEKLETKLQIAEWRIKELENKEEVSYASTHAEIATKKALESN